MKKVECLSLTLTNQCRRKVSDWLFIFYLWCYVNHVIIFGELALSLSHRLAVKAVH